MSNVLIKPKLTNTWLKGIIIILCLFLALWLARSQKYTFTPATQFTTVTGEKITLKALQGKPVLVTFWATSCGICIKEIPHLLAFYQQFHPQGLEIIAIAMVYDPPNRVVELANELKLPYSVVLDLSSEYDKAFGHIWGTPTTFLLNGESTVVKRYIGAFDVAELHSRIEELLKG